MLTERRERSHVETKDDFPLMWQMHTSITGPLRARERERGGEHTCRLYAFSTVVWEEQRGGTKWEEPTSQRQRQRVNTELRAAEKDGFVCLLCFFVQSDGLNSRVAAECWPASSSSSNVLNAHCRIRPWKETYIGAQFIIWFNPFLTAEPLNNMAARRKCVKLPAL